MQKVLGIIGGLVLGALCASFGLIETGFADVRFTTGNEWTPIVSAAGALAGGVLGSTAFFRSHVFSFLLAGLGLLTAIVIRDRYRLQPPAVFLDLFGFPFLGAAIGSRIDAWRARTGPRPSVVVLAGCAAVLGVAVIAVTVRGSEVTGSDDCEVRDGVTFCELSGPGGKKL